VGPRDGVALAGPGHPRAHAGLELLGRGHGSNSPGCARGDGSTRRAPPQPWDPNR
jgi:hypothetical protein